MRSPVASQRKIKKRSQSPISIGIPMASAKGAICGFIIFMLLSVVFSFICLLSKDPEKLLAPMALGSNAAGFFVCGYAACKKAKSAIPCGLLSGGILTVVCVIIAVCIPQSYSSSVSPTVTLLMRISMVAVSVIGAILATNSKVHSHKKARRK